MTSSPVSIMLNTSLQLIGLTTTMSTPTNKSDDSPSGAMNWSVPEGCTMVMLSQMNLSVWNYPDGIVSADERRLVQKIRQYIQVLLFLIGGPANVINMAVFYRQGLKDRVTLCLFFLALTDGLYVTIYTMFQAEEMYNLFLSKEGLGPYLTFVINNKLLIFIQLYFVSPILSSIIAIERCMCVFNPLKFAILLRTRTMALIIFVVYLAVYGLSFVVVFKFRIECFFDPTFNVRISVPIPGEFYKENKDYIHFIESFALGVGFLGGSMVTVTVATILTIIKLRHTNEWRSEASSSFSSRELALTKMLVGSSILFIVCTSPFAIFTFIGLFFPEVEYGQRDHNLYLCCVWIGDALLLIKPCSNIVVYYTMGSRYRETFWAVFGKKAKQQKLKKDKAGK